MLQITRAMSTVCPPLTIAATDPSAVAAHHALAPSAPKPCYAAIVLTENSKAKFGPNFDFYCKVKGFFKQVVGAAGVAAELQSLGFDVSPATVAEELAAYAAAAASGGKDAFGKQYFPDNFAEALAADAPLYIARVCPAIHYTMVCCPCLVGF